jgi:hypothetical protein
MVNQTFLDAVQDTKLVELTFDSKEKGVITCTCAPMDYGHMRNSNSPELKYHFYNLKSNHPMPISAQQIIKMRVLEEKFEPKNIISWQPDWHIVRDWGIYS